MAWVQKSAPGPSWNLVNAWHGSGTRWLLLSGTSLAATDDFEAYVTSTQQTNPANGQGITPLWACSDGAKWHVVGASGYFVSTDGLAGGAWAVSQALLAGSGDHGGFAIAAANGRLVVVSGTGKISLSTDGGISWVLKETIPSPGTNPAWFSVANRGDVWMVSAGATQIAVSVDNGDTWTRYLPTGARIGNIGAIPDGSWKFSLTTSGSNRRSTNNGATWSTDGYPSSNSQYMTTPGALYQYDPVAGLVYAYTTASREPIDMSGWPASVWEVAAGNVLVAVRATIGAPPYVAEGVNTPSIITLALSHMVVAPEYVRLPIAHQVVEGGEPIRLPIKHAVSPSYSVALPVSHSVISAAAVGGLAGAGGWPAAPSGAWRVVVVLGDADVSARLVGPVTVSRRDNDAAEAQFAFSPAAAIAPMDLIGQRVRVAFAELVGGMQVNAQTLFTGVLETPTVELHSGVVSCQCHDQLQEMVAATGREWIDAAVGGRWAEAVSGAPEDNWDYLQERIASVPMSFALDRLQQLRIVPWRGAGLVVRSLHVQDPVDASLSVTLPSRSDLRTRTTVRCQYRYARRRGRGATAAWAQSLRWFTGYNYAASPWLSKQWLTVSMIDSALSSVRGWELRGTIDIERPPAGVHPLGPAETDGGYVIRKDVAAELALGFAAAYTAEWTQTVTEDYTVTLILPDLEAAIGQVGEEVGATLQAAFDADEVVDLGIPVSGDTSVAWQPEGFDVAARDNVLHTLCDRAWVAMYAASRAGRVRWKMPLRPDLWLDWWFELSTPWLNANGKVVEVRHVLDPDAGSALTEVAIAVGLPGNADAALPTWSLPAVAWPDESRPAAAYSFDVGTFVGGEVGAPPDDESWNGFITNVERGVELDQYNWYSRRLAIKAPDIDAADRDPLEVLAEATIDTAIPTSLLEIL